MKFLIGTILAAVLPYISLTQECRSKLDMCIVLDTSDAVINTFSTLGFLKEGLKNYLGFFDIGLSADQDQLGVCIYGGLGTPPAQEVITLGVNQDVTLMRNAIGSFPQGGVNSGFTTLKGGSNIGAGLDCCRLMLANNGRAANQDIVVLVTLIDADTPTNEAALVTAATELKKTAHLSTVTVGQLFSSKTEISDLASDADSATDIANYQPWVDDSLSPTPLALKSLCPAALVPPPNPCNGCKWMNGIGYAPTENCWEYYQCDRDTMQPIRRTTAFGTFWDNNELKQYAPSPDFVCPDDPCLSLTLGAMYGRPDHCKIWMKCNDFMPMTESINCCPDEHRFDATLGLCVSDSTCTQNCIEDFQNVCDLTAIPGNTHAFQQAEETIMCAPGTMFDAQECGCVMDPLQMILLEQSAPVCKPEFHLDFSGGLILDKSVNHYKIDNEGVTTQLSSGEWVGVFNQPGSLLRVLGFSNNDFQSRLAIYVRARPTAFQMNTALISNSDCEVNKETYALLMNSFIAGQSLLQSFALTKFDGPITTDSAAPNPTTGFHDIVYEYDGAQLTVLADGKFKEKSGGPLLVMQQPSCALIIGNGLSFNDFVGEISEVRVYKCERPNTEDYLVV